MDINIDVISKSSLREIIQNNCILSNNLKHPVYKKNGVNAKWMFDIRQILFVPSILEFIANQFWNNFEKYLPFQITGLEFSATPIVTAIVIEGRRRGHFISASIVRKERKTSGYCRHFEGQQDQHPVVFVDDILNSGYSFSKSIDAFDQDILVKAVFSIVDFKKTIGIARSVVRHSLFELDDFGLSIEPKNSFIGQSDLKPQWHFRVSQPNYSIVIERSSPLLREGRVYFGASDSKLYCIDAINGKQVWSNQHRKLPKGIVSSPTYTDGQVIYGSYEGNLYSVNEITGAINWVNELADYIGASPALYMGKKPFGAIGLEFGAPLSKGGLALFDTRNGDVTWLMRVPNWAHCSPHITSDGVEVIFGDNDGNVYCLDNNERSVRWRFQSGSAVKSGFASDEQAVYFGNFEGKIFALNRNDGSVCWEYPTTGPIYSTPAISLDSLGVGSTDKTFYLINKRYGHEISQHHTLGKIYSTATLHNDMFWFGSNDGSINAIDAQSGQLARQVVVRERIVGKIAIDEQRLIATSGSDLFCFEL